jgi:hypothetical protein
VVAQLTTVYASVPALGLWVPVRFQERYEQTQFRNTLNAHEVIVCDAHYTNHRRFEVTVRIK